MMSALDSYRRVIRANRQLADGTAILNKMGFLHPIRQPPFRSGEATRCIGCGASQWIVGRHSAECGVCGNPATLATPTTTTHLTTRKKG